MECCTYSTAQTALMNDFVWVDLVSARELFDQDNEGMVWEEWLDEYIVDIRALHNSQVGGGPYRSYDEFRGELGL